MKELYEKPEVDQISFQPADIVTGNVDVGDGPVVGGSIDEW